MKYVTHTRTILADVYTPVGAYMRLRDLYPQSALMESSDYHDANNSRSFIGICPMASIAIGHGLCTMTLPDSSTTQTVIDGNYTTDKALADFLGNFQVEGENANYIGLYGYTTFNAVRYFENINVKDSTMDENDAPDVLYVLYRDIIVFDHHNSEMTLVTIGDESVLDDIERTINKPTARTYGFHAVGEVTSTLTDEEHKKNIREGIRHCLRGDVFQIVLSRRFIQRYEGDDFNLYRALRSINPSPYLFYFDFGGFRIFGSSPETHCRIEGNRAYIDPIAGTTRRTGDSEQDKKNTEYLRNDPKENAEHVMLVDLARNDLSRNCRGVKVDFFKDLQYYSHVIHLVSRVSGDIEESEELRVKSERLRVGDGTSGMELRAKLKTFIDTLRAMQIISELEPHNRGAYGGCIGYIGLNGDLNQAITIRTFVSRGGELWFQAGGGIVAKSDEEYELQEVNNKLGALRKAIERAEQ